MTTELWVLLASCLLGLVHLTAASFSFKNQVGNRYTVGPRDEKLTPVGIAGRLHRAQINFLETFCIFATVVAIAHLSGTQGELSQWGSLIYLVGRVLYLPLYAVGVFWIRTLSWNLATLGVALVGAQIVVSNA